MKNQASIALIALALTAFPAIGQEYFGLEAHVRVGGSAVETIEIHLASGFTQTVDLGNGVQIEFSAPAPGAGAPSTMVRLLRPEENGARILHTTRQGGDASRARKNGYLVCANGVTFLSPSPESLPSCDD